MIEIRHLDKTCLDADAFHKLVEKYSKNLHYKVSIVFDLRIKDYANYLFDGIKRKHMIKINPERCAHHYEKNFEDGTFKEIKLGKKAETYNVIGSIIHELFHARQKEELGRAFENVSFDGIKGMTNPAMASWYSECETEARIYENKNLNKAVEHYNKYCKD